MDSGPAEALLAAGATRVQVSAMPCCPSCSPRLGSLALYRLEQNVRSSLVLGFVGAGASLPAAQRHEEFQYRRGEHAALVLFALITVFELGSARVRAALR